MRRPSPPLEHFLAIDGIDGAHAELHAAEARTLYQATVAAHRDQPGRHAVVLYVWSPHGHFSQIARSVVGGDPFSAADRRLVRRTRSGAAASQAL